MDIELVAKWRPTGLLKNCNTEIEQILLCTLLEEGAQHLVENRLSDFVRGLLLPAITRIYYATKKSTVDFDELCQILESYNLLSDSAITYCTLDYEVESCSKATDDYIKANS